MDGWLQPLIKMPGRQDLGEQKFSAGDSDPKEGISLYSSSAGSAFPVDPLVWCTREWSGRGAAASFYRNLIYQRSSDRDAVCGTTQNIQLYSFIPDKLYMSEMIEHK